MNGEYFYFLVRNDGAIINKTSSTNDVSEDFNLLKNFICFSVV
jgi:hypothetical protein